MKASSGCSYTSLKGQNFYHKGDKWPRSAWAFLTSSKRTAHYSSKNDSKNTDLKVMSYSTSAGCQRIGMPGLDNELSNNKTVQRMAVWSAHFCRSNSYLLCPRRVTWIKTKKVDVWRADVPALSNRASFVSVAKPIYAATPELGTSACYISTNHHHATDYTTKHTAKSIWAWTTGFKNWEIFLSKKNIIEKSF